jgi:protein O-mannosyl-transferase
MAMDRSAIGWIGLPVLCLVFFANIYGGDFHYDDEHSIRSNPYIRSWDNVAGFFGTEGSGYFSVDPEKRMYRPLLLTSYAANYALDGYRPRFYLLMNWALHLGCTLLVWRLGLRLLADRRAALWAGMLFALHPLAAEPVNYISSRSESLAAFCILAALLLHCRGQLFAAAGSLVLALLSKSVAVVAAPLFWWLDTRVCRRPLPLRSYAVYFIISAAYTAFVFADRWGQTLQALPVRDGASQFWTQLKAPVYYLFLLIAPVRLNVEHQFIESATVNLPALLGAALLASIAVFVWKGRRRLWGWALLFSGAVLLPTAVVPLNVLVNERRLYLVTAALTWALAQVLRRHLQGAPGRAVLMFSLPLVLGLLSFERNWVWRDQSALWEDAVAKAPLMYRAQVNVGKARQGASDYDGALLAYDAALALDGRFADVYNNIATIKHEQGRWPDAVVWYQKSLSRDNGKAEIWQNLAAAYTASGDNVAAVKALERAVELRPGNAGLWNNYGQALYGDGRLPQAATAFRRALEVDPNLVEAHNNLGNVYSQSGAREEAVRHYNLALSATKKAEDAAQPSAASAAEIWANLADVYRQAGDNQQADQAIRQALLLDDGQARYWAIKGRIAWQSADSLEARRAFERSLVHNGGQARVHAELGEILLAGGQSEEAMRYFEKAVQLDQNSSRAWYGWATAARTKGDSATALKAYTFFIKLWPHRDRRYMAATEYLNKARAQSGLDEGSGLDRGARSNRGQDSSRVQDSNRVQRR